MYAGAHPGSAAAGSGVSRAASDPTMSRASSQQQLVADHQRSATTSGAAEAGSRAAGGGKVKSEKASSAADHYVQRVGPYTTPQQYMLNKRAKYAAAAATPVAAEVLRYAIQYYILVITVLNHLPFGFWVFGLNTVFLKCRISWVSGFSWVSVRM